MTGGAELGGAAAAAAGIGTVCVVLVEGIWVAARNGSSHMVLCVL